MQDERQGDHQLGRRRGDELARERERPWSSPCEDGNPGPNISNPIGITAIPWCCANNDQTFCSSGPMSNQSNSPGAINTGYCIANNSSECAHTGGDKIGL